MLCRRAAYALSAGLGLVPACGGQTDTLGRTSPAAAGSAGAVAGQGGGVSSAGASGNPAGGASNSEGGSAGNATGAGGANAAAGGSPAAVGGASAGGGHSAGGVAEGGAGQSAPGGSPGGGAGTGGSGGSVVGGLQPGSPWPMLLRNSRHTGAASVKGPKQAKAKWVTSGGSECCAASASVIAADGTIYAVSTWFGIHGGSSLWAFRPDGSTMWPHVDLGDDGPMYWDPVPPLLAGDGTIYVASGESLFAINPDGSQKWVRELGGALNRSSVAVGDDGTIYCGALGLRAFTPDGSTIWSTEDLCASPALGSDGTIYCSWKRSELTAFAPDGTQKWTSPVDTALTAPAAIDEDGTIYAVSTDTLYAFAPGGALKSKVSTGMQQARYLSIAGDGSVYVGGPNGLAVFENGGSLKWTTSQPVLSPMAIDADAVVFFSSVLSTTDSRAVYALEPDGSLSWSHLGFFTTSGPAIGADGTLYVSTGDGMTAIGP